MIGRLEHRHVCIEFAITLSMITTFVHEYEQYKLIKPLFCVIVAFPKLIVASFKKSADDQEGASDWTENQYRILMDEQQ